MEYLKLYEDPQVDDEGNTKKERMTEETIRLKVNLSKLRNQCNSKMVY